MGEVLTGLGALLALFAVWGIMNSDERSDVSSDWRKCRHCYGGTASRPPPMPGESTYYYKCFRCDGKGEVRR